ncbi:MAG: putative aminomethyltransferase [Thermoproteota archaeon]|nr:putative aminomethyltransferase [Thermoproteota archaeon]
MKVESRRTHIFQYHADHGNMINFHGFEMPLWYDSISSEHMAVRDNCGLFDVTHMGRSIVSGEKAGEFLDYILTRDPSKLGLIQGQYSTMCNERGGIIDDLTVFCLENKRYLVVYNASNREKDYDWIISKSQTFNVEVQDVSDMTPLFALQGPKAQIILQKLTDGGLSKIRRYWADQLVVGGEKALVSRSGYTGEDGFEILLWDVPLESPGKAMVLWNRILEAGVSFGIKPCGLGARDTLRLEAGMCLYGNDINDETTPLEAKLDFAVKFEKPNFIGREALLKQKEEGIKKTRVGLKMVDRAVPREGGRVWMNGKEVGYLTSGTFSPLLKYGIAMGYVSVDYAVEGSILEVEVRNSRFKTEVVKMPFYEVEKYGARRKTSQA